MGEDGARAGAGAGAGATYGLEPSVEELMTLSS